ncbi:hypothetical protein HDU87_002511 [Geranomyces variabilis]|uniref:Uncharacterized protein n=1 Tax=Geranomyces variabilis TaxID=109894 RepID=A0AAD5TRA1_9FUNG|nr:hypothetical protein HDU87_002511 [Geranomyces variabilis]
MSRSTMGVRGRRRLSLGRVALLPLFLAFALALLSGVSAQIIGVNSTSIIIESTTTPVVPSTSIIIPPTTTPVIPSTSLTPPVVSSSTSVRPPPPTSTPQRSTIVISLTSTAAVSTPSTASTASAATPTPTPTPPPTPGPALTQGQKKALTWAGAAFGIVAGSIALAVVGIYIFRKATLRPSSEFRKRMHRTQYGDGGGSGTGSSTGLSTLHSNASHQNLNPYAAGGASAATIDDYRSSAGTPDGRGGGPARYHYDYPISDYASDAGGGGGLSSPDPVAGTSRYAATQQQYAYYPTHAPSTSGGAAGYASAAGSEYGGYSPSEYAQYPPQPLPAHDYGGGQQHHPAYSSPGGGGGQYPAY